MSREDTLDRWRIRMEGTSFRAMPASDRRIPSAISLMAFRQESQGPPAVLLLSSG
jgi:hypothetical protein